ncbi:MAG: universal stress protein [Gammaproteobacteria bacterium]|nr:universal stress protein [Gammaproteobacteria bacterium]
MLPDLRNILYATDMSDNAAPAFQYVMLLAKKIGADVHILHVVERLSNDARITLESYVLDEDQRKRVLNERVSNAKKLLNQCLEDVTSRLEGEDRKLRERIVSIEVCESYPVEEILKRGQACDLIVMGTHEKGFMSPFIGSVAKSVLHSSSVPVLVVPLPPR